MEEKNVIQKRHIDWKYSLFNHFKEGNHIFNLIFKGSSTQIYIYINRKQPYPLNEEACVLSIAITLHQHHYQHNHVHQFALTTEASAIRNVWESWILNLGRPDSEQLLGNLIPHYMCSLSTEATNLPNVEIITKFIA